MGDGDWGLEKAVFRRFHPPAPSPHPPAPSPQPPFFASLREVLLNIRRDAGAELLTDAFNLSKLVLNTLEELRL